MNTPYMIRRASESKRQRTFPAAYRRGQYQLTYETVAHDRHHFHLPRTPEDWRLSHTEKDIFFSALVESVEAVHDATPESKRRLLEARTGLPHITSELREGFSLLLDPKHAVSKEHGAVNMTDDAIFIKSRPQLLDARGRPIPIDDTNGPISWDVRERARFYTFHVIVNGKQAFTGNQDIKDKIDTPRLELDVGISLPSVRRTPPYGGANFFFLGNGQKVDVLHEALNLQVLTDPSLVLQQVEAILGFPPAIGYVKKDAGHLHYKVDNIAFYTEFKKYYHRVFYDHYLLYLEMEFKAGSTIDYATLEDTLRSKRQQYITKDTKQIVTLTVDEYYRSFTSILGLFRGQTRYKFDLAQAFFHGLLPDIKQKARSEKYSTPPMGYNELKQQSEERLRKVKEKALLFEEQTRAIQGIVSRHNKNFTRVSTNTAYMHPFQPLPETNFQDTTYPPIDLDELEEMPFEDLEDHGHTSQVMAGLPTQDSTPQQLMDDPDFYLFYCTINASMAEQALQKATGTSKQLACWGCGSLEHRWYNCPHRSKPEYIAQARKMMLQFMKNKETKKRDTKPAPSPYQTRATSLQENWKKEGYPTAAIAQTVVTLCDPDTPMDTRNSLCDTLQTQLRDALPPPQPPRVAVATKKVAFVLAATPSIPAAASTKEGTPARLAQTAPATNFQQTRQRLHDLLLFHRVLNLAKVQTIDTTDTKLVSVIVPTTEPSPICLLHNTRQGEHLEIGDIVEDLSGLTETHKGTNRKTHPPSPKGPYPKPKRQYQWGDLPGLDDSSSEDEIRETEDGTVQLFPAPFLEQADNDSWMTSTKSLIQATHEENSTTPAPPTCACNKETSNANHPHNKRGRPPLNLPSMTNKKKQPPPKVASSFAAIPRISPISLRPETSLAQTEHAEQTSDEDNATQFEDDPEDTTHSPRTLSPVTFQRTPFPSTLGDLLRLPPPWYPNAPGFAWRNLHPSMNIRQREAFEREQQYLEIDEHDRYSYITGMYRFIANLRNRQPELCVQIRVRRRCSAWQPPLIWKFVSHAWPQNKQDIRHLALYGRWCPDHMHPLWHWAYLPQMFQTFEQEMSQLMDLLDGTPEAQQFVQEETRALIERSETERLEILDWLYSDECIHNGRFDKGPFPYLYSHLGDPTLPRFQRAYHHTYWQDPHRDPKEYAQEIPGATPFPFPWVFYQSNDLDTFSDSSHSLADLLDSQEEVTDNDVTSSDESENRPVIRNFAAIPKIADKNPDCNSTHWKNNKIVTQTTNNETVNEIKLDTNPTRCNINKTENREAAKYTTSHGGTGHSLEVKHDRHTFLVPTAPPCWRLTDKETDRYIAKIERSIQAVNRPIYSTSKASHIYRTEGIHALMNYLYKCDGHDGPPVPPSDERFDNMTIEELFFADDHLYDLTPSANPHTSAPDTSAQEPCSQNQSRNPQHTSTNPKERRVHTTVCMATATPEPAQHDKPFSPFDVVFEHLQKGSFPSLPGNIFLTKITKLLARSLFGQGPLFASSTSTTETAVEAIYTQTTKRGGSFYGIKTYDRTGRPDTFKTLSKQDAITFLTKRWHLECYSRSSLKHPENVCVIEEICSNLDEAIKILKKENITPNQRVSITLYVQNAIHRLQQLFGISSLCIPHADNERKLLPHIPNEDTEPTTKRSKTPMRIMDYYDPPDQDHSTRALACPDSIPFPTSRLKFRPSRRTIYQFGSSVLHSRPLRKRPPRPSFLSLQRERTPRPQQGEDYEERIHRSIFTDEETTEDGPPKPLQQEAVMEQLLERCNNTIDHALQDTTRVGNKSRQHTHSLIHDSPAPHPDWPLIWSKSTDYVAFEPPALQRFRGLLHDPDMNGYKTSFTAAQVDDYNPLLYHETLEDDLARRRAGIPSLLDPLTDCFDPPPDYYEYDSKEHSPSIEDDTLWYAADNKKGPAPSASPVLVANATTFKTPLLPLSDKMPHVHFNIGDKMTDATLCAMLDTGAGCNLGREDYHMAIEKRCPDLVLAVESQVNNSEWTNIHVGSIEEQGTPIVITSVIVYKTPFTTDGHPVQLRIGLAKNAAINTIFGIPFFRATQSVVHFRTTEHGSDQLVCPRIGTNLPVIMQTPSCTNSPDSIDKPDRRMSQTYSATPEVKKGFLVSPDAEALLNPEMHSRAPQDGDEFQMIEDGS